MNLELLEDRLAPATLNWIGGGGDNNWSNPANWSGSTSGPANGDILRFDTTAAGFTGAFISNNDIPGLSLGGLQIVDSSAAGDFSISGQAVTLAGTLTHNQTQGAASSLALAGITLSNALTLTHSAGALTLGAMNLGTFTLTVSAAATAGTITMASIAGDGRLNLDRGELMVTGDLDVDNLRIAFLNTASSPTTTTASLTVGAGAEVNIGRGAGNTLSVGERTGNANPSDAPVTGTLDLSLAESVTINVGNLTIGNIPSSMAVATPDGDTVGHLLLSVEGDNHVTATSIVMGHSTGVFNVVPVSTMKLGGGLNTFRVDSFIIGGNKGHAEVSIASGGTLDLMNKDGTGGANLYLGNNDGGGTSSHGSGSLDLTGGAFNATLNELVIGRFVTSGGSGSGTLIMSGGSVTAATVLIAQAGASSSNQNVGILTLNGGTLNATTVTLSQGRGLATLNIAGGALNASTLSLAPGTGGTATVNLNSGTLAAQTITRNGTAGTVAFNWNGGTLRNLAGADLSIASIPVAVLGAGMHTFVVDAGRSATVQASSGLTGAGGLAKDGEGTLVLAGVNSLTGAVAVDEGTLQVDGSLATSAAAVTVSGTLAGGGTINRTVNVLSGGIIAPGNGGPGVLTATNVVFADGAIFRADLLGLTEHDQLLAGDIDLGNATLELVGGFTPPDLFEILLMDATTLTGQFDGIDEGGLASVGDFLGGVSYEGNQVRLTDEILINLAPIVDDQAFTAAGASDSGAVVGTVVATDPNAGQSLSYTIVAGNTGGAFAIDAATGVITVANPTALQGSTQFTLTVQVSDNGVPALSSTATITIHVNDAPLISDQEFDLSEDSADGATVGTVAASDPNPGQSLTFAITAGNTGDTFVIDAATGVISVADSTLLDFDLNPVFSLTVQVTDNGTPNLSRTAVITIHVTDVNESPVIDDQEFSVVENSDVGTVVGDVLASDPNTGQSLSYVIVAGNTGGTFAINAATGQITVANKSLLDFETNPTFTLTVQVTDNGVPILNRTATITIHVLEFNEPPVIGNQSFLLDENVPGGTVVGTVAASDPNTSQSLTYAITAGNSGNAFAIDAATGEITVLTPEVLDFESIPVFSLTVQVTDNGVPSLSSSAIVTINLNNRNDAPIASELSVTTPLLAPITIDLRTLVRDVETPLDQLTFMVGNPVNGTVILLDGHTAQFTGAALGPASFTYSVTDTATGGDAALTTGPVTIHVLIEDPQPSPPEASDDVYDTDEDSAVSGNLLTDDTGAGPDTDPNDDPLTVSAVNGDSTAVGIPVTLASGAQVTVNADGSFSYDPSTSALFNQLAAGATAVDSFTYTVSDGQGGLDTAVVTINIVGVNDAPVGPRALKLVGRNNAATRISLAQQLAGFTDPEGDPVHVEIVKKPKHGKLVQKANGKLVYRPPMNFKGKVTFTYRVVDANGESSEVTVLLKIIRKGRQGKR